MAPERKFRICVLLSGDWEVFHRPASLSYFLDHHEVILVQKPVDLFLSWFLNRNRIKDFLFNRVSRTGSTVKIRPLIFFHEYFAPFLPFTVWINRWLLKIQIGRYFRKERGIKRVLWTYHPVHAHSLELFGEDITVYECYDAHTRQSGLSAARKGQLVRDDLTLLQQSHLVLTTSEKLLEEKGAVNPATHNLPNGVDYEFFSAIGRWEIRRGGKITAGYLGSLNDLVDTALLRGIIEAAPDCRFLIIGPEMFTDRENIRNFARIRTLPNVDYRGPVYGDGLGELCRQFDVSIITYALDSEYIEYSCPNKVNEFLAMGLPVITTRVRELLRYEKDVVFADKPEEFVYHIKNEVKTDTMDRITARKNTAAANSWEKRSARIEQLLTETETAERTE